MTKEAGDWKDNKLSSEFLDDTYGVIGTSTVLAHRLGHVDWRLMPKQTRNTVGKVAAYDGTLVDLKDNSWKFEHYLLTLPSLTGMNMSIEKGKVFGVHTSGDIVARYW